VLLEHMLKMLQIVIIPWTKQFLLLNKINAQFPMQKSIYSTLTGALSAQISFSQNNWNSGMHVTDVKHIVPTQGQQDTMWCLML
jgi:hypothetical protein